MMEILNKMPFVDFYSEKRSKVYIKKLGIQFGSD